MVKKLLAGAAGAAMFLAVAAPALASSYIWNGAQVINEIFTVANTGGNLMLAGDEVNGGTINSGNAVAVTEVTNVVNSNDVDSWDCGCDGSYIENWAFVYNGVGTLANTGENVIAAEDDVDGGMINSGSAGAASVVTNVVNTNVVSDFWWPI